ncbi:McrC family protein [Desemzia sp. FAM 23991]|uniref:McrC family protein n=1 Tax=unclassified Desemzia TaxID=2685243 RepID=UPI0038895A86
MNRTITIAEYGRIQVNDIFQGVKITPKDIRELRNFIDEINTQTSANNSSNISDYLRPIRNGVQANNYVGVLQTKSGLTIEILPKISRTQQDTQQVKNLFIDMLRTVKQIDGKSFDMSNLNENKNNILEIFISMFITEVNRIIKRGLKSDYTTRRSNEAYLKGKLLIKQQIQTNSVNKAKFYNEFDEFEVDGAENQLIKTTLNYLLGMSHDAKNQRLIREQLMYFEKVSLTYHPQVTFQRVSIKRQFQYYERALKWAEIFLKRKSFTSFKGSSLAFALLFPMEKVFEAYIADKMKKAFPDVQVNTQEQHYFLFDKNEKNKSSYRLRPDIVIRSNQENGNVVIVDTKWKLLKNDGPSQADLYQMYAYFTRYFHHSEAIQKVVLLYPKSESYDERIFKSLNFFDNKSEIGAKIEVKYIDLFSDDIKSRLQQIVMN